MPVETAGAGQRLRIVTWNVNGLKRLCQLRPLGAWLRALGADVLCVQETKATREALDSSTALVEGFLPFFSFCRTQRGYSGVCTFVRRGLPVLAAQDGLTGTLTESGDCIVMNQVRGEGGEVVDLDREGRAMITDHGSFLLLNVYAPCGSDDSRYEFKLKYHSLIESTCHLLRVTHNKPVIVVGDLNVAHRMIDHCDPPPDFEEYEHRKWINRMLNDDMGGFVDTFRAFHPTRAKAYTCWNTKTSARQTNFGTRIDFILASKQFMPSVIDADIMPEFMGSDHCPVWIDIRVDDTMKQLMDSGPWPIPQLCSSNFPEFSGKQQSLKSFLSVKVATATSVSTHGTQQDQTQHVEMDEVSLAATSTTTTVRPAPQRDLDEDFQQDQKSRKQVKLWSFFGGPQGATPQKREHTFQSAREVAERANKTKENPSTEEASDADGKSSPTQAARTPLAQLPPEPPAAQQAWKSLLGGPEKPPICTGHKEPSVERTVLKDGPNKGRRFYVCWRPAGNFFEDRTARCDFFVWRDEKPRARLKRSHTDGSTGSDEPNPKRVEHRL